MVEKAILEGFRGIDTALQPKHYDEKQVETALKNLKEQDIKREDLYLQTKFTPLSGQDKNNLQTSYLDTLILQSPIKPAIVQNIFHKESAYDVKLRAWCDENNIIYQSFWTITDNEHILNSDTLTDIAQSKQKTSVQILFKYLNQIRILEFELQDEELSLIDNLL